uniref:Uncharacterized protein n=1 Tax=Panagrolaimus sp. JU765 TaxID=591449 RepID=A0AC34RA36_9BILA
MMLDTIKQQLEKIAKKNEMSADDELVKIIQCIGNYDTSIVDGLKSIETEQLDGDTTVLIENFLNSLI